MEIMKKLMLIAMVSLGVISCSKENSRNPQKINTEDNIVRPIIGDVPYEYVGVFYSIEEQYLPITEEANFYEVSDHDTWRKLTNNAEDLSSNLSVNFNTHRVLIIRDSKDKPDGDVYSFKISSMVGDESNIVVKVQTVVYHGAIFGPTDAPFPGIVVKIPKTEQSISLQQLPDEHRDAPDYE